MFHSCIPASMTGTFGRNEELNLRSNAAEEPNTNANDRGNDCEDDDWDSGSLWERWIRRKRYGYKNQNGNRNRSDGTVRSVLTLDPSTGALKIPVYKVISRADHCPLLKSAWGQDWEELLRICQSQPSRTLHTTKTSGRTALHLSTFNKRCPLAVARALLRANRHAILVRDSNQYTPLHIVAFFSSSALWNGVGEGNADVDTGADENENENENEQKERRVRYCEIEVESVVALFCDTAILVEQELRGSGGRCPQTDTNTHENEDNDDIVWFHCSRIEPQISPLYLAAKKDAPLRILKRLVNTRSRTYWIAPCTGGEPYYWQPRASSKPGSIQPLTNACLSSPLEILLREDRLRHSTEDHFGSSHGSRDRDAYLLEEEEDGNHPSSRTETRFRAPTTSTRLRNPLPSRPLSSATGGRTGGRSNQRSFRSRSPFHPDELEGVPRLVQTMRRLAIGRCREHYRGHHDHHHHSQTRNRCSPLDPQHTNESGMDDCASDPCWKREEDAPTETSSSASPPWNEFTNSQQKCLEMWEKCIELLATAGGGGIPLLEVGADEHQNPRQLQLQLQLRQQAPYGILHACVCCKVPVPSLVEIALRVFPEQAYQRDLRHGMIPLHHLLRARHPPHAMSRILAILLHGTTKGQMSRCMPTQQPEICSSKSRSGDGAGAALTRRTDAVESVDYGIPQHVSGTKPGPSADYLRPTVLVPLPSERNSTNGDHDNVVARAGPTPLAYAIRLGLPMDTVIDPLLEADSHTSLRILDPTTDLPPFALVATKVPRHEAVRGHLIRCNQIGSSHRSTTPRTETDDESQPHDLVVSLIESTIQAFSAGDGDGGFRRSTSTSTTTGTTGTTKGSGRAKDSTHTPATPTVTYTVNDIYRLLLAHPQVLAQYTLS